MVYVVNVQRLDRAEAAADELDHIIIGRWIGRGIALSTAF